MTVWPTQQHVTFRCTHCRRWKFVGPLDEGRELAAAHALEQHGLKPRYRRYKMTRQKFRLPVGNTDIDTNITNARQQGAAGWASET